MSVRVSAGRGDPMSSLDLDLVPQLRRAVDDDELVVHFQPEVDLASGAVAGMEALLRWRHPDRGLLWPADFLAVADGAGLLPRIGWVVLQRCAAELSTWSPLPPTDDGTPRQMWVNVAASQLLADGFVDDVVELRDRFRLAPRTLGIEVTEEALARDTDRAMSILNRLHSMGVALAIDD